MRYIALSLLVILPLSAVAGGETAREIVVEEARTYRQEGYKLQSEGNLQGALAYYQKAVELDPSFVEAMNDLGVIFENLDENEQALTMYRRAIEVNKDYLPTYTNLGFLYEKMGDVKNATDYWQKRYELGHQGDYWWEVARQHLIALGTYPQVRKDMLEKAALRLSRKLVYTREQERLANNEEASLHLSIGTKLLRQGDYSQAVKELQTARSLNPTDTKLAEKIELFYKRAAVMEVKHQAMFDTQEALNHIKKDDFLSAGEKLKEALSAVFSIAKEK